MSFLLDTNVVSEWTKPQQDRFLAAWLAAVEEELLFLSVVSFAEIRSGIERMAPGRKRERLQAWLGEDLAARFADRMVAIDRSIAETWGVLVQRAKRAGVSLGSIDAFFAATAQVHKLTLVTRNVKDFRNLGVELFDPRNASA